MALTNKKGKGKSPYKKYGKRPWQYSEAYRRWRAAIIKGDERAARRASEDHADRFLRGRVPIEDEREAA